MITGSGGGSSSSSSSSSNSNTFYSFASSCATPPRKTNLISSVETNYFLYIPMVPIHTFILAHVLY